MAAVMGVPYKNEDYITLISPVGTGIIKLLHLADDLQVLVADATFYQHVLAKRDYSEKRYYILHFDDLYIQHSATFSVDGEKLHKTNTRHSVARLTSNVFFNTEEIAANTPFKTIKIFFSEAWLKKYLGLDAAENGLEKYVSLKTASFDIEKLDADYLRLMDELWHAEKGDTLQNIFLQNRVTLLMELFFTRLTQKLQHLHLHHTLNESDVERVAEVEKIITAGYSSTPLTIDELACKINMSSTRLKTNFKLLYGDSIYAYYQKMRLQKARELLLSGRYTINKVAHAVGYASTSNFILAFKKQFNQLPGQMLRQKT